MNIIGHTDTVKLLQSHTTPRSSYIFYGPSGVGKKHTAIEYFRYLSCTNHTDTCKTCYQIDYNTHPDLNIYTPEKNQYGVSEIHTILDRSNEYPDSAPYRFLILDQGSDITKQAANALLKNLEDGSPRSVYVFCVEDEHDVLDTIHSRSVSIQFSHLSIDQISTYLSKYSEDQDRINICARLGRGSIGTALSYFQGTGHIIRDQALDLLNSVSAKPYHQLLTTIESMENPEQIFDIYRTLITDMYLLHVGSNHITHIDKIDTLKKHLVTYQKVLNIYVTMCNKLYAQLPYIKSTFSSHFKSMILQMKRSLYV